MLQERYAANRTIACNIHCTAKGRAWACYGQSCGRSYYNVSVLLYFDEYRRGGVVKPAYEKSV
jgi:hypothetical protein